MQIPDKAVESATELDRASFERLREKWFRPPYDQYGLNLLRQMKTNELVLTQYYCGRAPYELLQNADDVRASEAVFVLLPEGLVFAHNGGWFNARNFKSLADGWSDKDPNQCIGHKGLGFRSVLEITPSPHIVRLSPGAFFAVRFSQTLNQAHIDETLRRHPDLRAEVQEWTKNRQSACPVMYISALIERHQLGTCAAIYEALRQGRYGAAFTTMFWFPVDDPSGMHIKDNPASAPIRAGGAGQTRLIGWVTKEVPILLPFLRSIRRVAIYEGDTSLAETTTQETGQDTGLSEVVVEIRSPGQIQQYQFLLMRDNVRIPRQVKNEQGTPVALRQMDTARIVLALRLNDSRPALADRPKMHVYFPTEEASGFPFTVHADFQVKPDRTELIPGSYNQWLFQQIAALATGEFLTQLLARFDAADALEALAPTGDPLAGSTKEFIQAVIGALRNRHVPFVPTRLGLLPADAVVMPRDEDRDGFWNDHFAGLLGGLRAEKRAFLLPKADRPSVRRLLHQIGVEQLPDAAVLDLMEQTKECPQSPGWWYECYTYLSRHKDLSRWPPTRFVGRGLIPLADDTLGLVPGEVDKVVCLPSLSIGGERTPPRLFDQVFVWANRDLAALILQGDSSVRSWLVDRLALTPFEATQLLPRAVRKLAPRIFGGELEVTILSLERSWLFMKWVIGASKVNIGGDVFWQEIGRFPVLVQSSAPYRDIASPRPEQIAPAFLTFFPEEVTDSSALRGVKDLPRIDLSFFRKLVAASGEEESQWVEFFRNAGIAATPKVLEYARVVQRSDDVTMDAEALTARRSKPYTGERQLDENEAVLETLEGDGLWSEFCSPSFCSHPASKVLHSLSAIRGLRPATELAQREWVADDKASCRRRLWSLVDSLAAAANSRDRDQVYCRGGLGGHSIPAGEYINRQLRRFRWLPASHGPAAIDECFFRRPGYSLISSGRQGDDFGDGILPYVIAENSYLVAQLEQLGVEELGSAAAAKSRTLVRALHMIGERLSLEGAQAEVLSDRRRWRLVRGAIQEIYRILNQRSDALTWPDSLKLAVRRSEGPAFRPRPVFFADPGSPVEQAFMPHLPLIDADRPYRDLFKSLEVVRLTAGESVIEQFLGDEEAKAAQALQREIRERLAPYLLSVILAKSDRPEERDVILRRLSDRFEVRAAAKLKVSYALKETPAERHLIDFPHFYMQRRVERGTGAGQEAYFTLFIEGEPGTSIFDHQIDGDALGAALVPLFQDDASDEIRSLFPRVVSRFCQTRGGANEMSEFIYRQLGVSCEVLDNAQTLIAEGEKMVLPPPPPPVVLVERLDHGGGSTSASLESLLDNQQNKITEAATKLVNTLRDVHAGHAIVSPGGNDEAVTSAQQDRGTRGEEEIKRRLEGPAGWASYKLVRDRRGDRCGYDFLCRAGDSEIALEVKTFTENGTINMTQKELLVAAQMGEHYHLLGVLDNGGSENCWPTFVLLDPLRTLLQQGHFETDAKLQVSADILFTEDRGVEGR